MVSPLLRDRDAPPPSDRIARRGDLVMFGEDWGRFPTSTQHLARHMAETRRIVYVNSVGLRRPRLDVRDFRRLIDKARQSQERGGEGGDGRSAGDVQAQTPAGLTVVPPMVIPWPGSRLALAINGPLLGRQIGAGMAKAGIEHPILWISIPTGFAASGHLGERALVYYCPDDYSALDGVDNAAVAAIEARMVEKADLVLACSDVLAARFPKDKTLLLPHGVDVDVFTRPAERAADLPRADKIAGFYGSFLDRIDVAALVEAVERLADWMFVFVGDIKPAEAPQLFGRPNVCFLGQRPHHDLPRYAQHWTVSMLPFKDTAMVRAMNPLKLREYLANGAPIAAIDFPALAPYRSLVSTMAPGGDFAATLLAAAADHQRNALRRAAVAGETWAARARQAEAALDRL